MTTQAPLNEVQLTLLRLFSRPMDDKEILALRAMLIEFYERSLQEELDRVIDEKEIQRRGFEDRLNRQQRTNK